MNSSNRSHIRRRIAILAPRLDERDATGTDCINMYDLLNRAGYDARLFGGGWNISEPVEHIKNITKFLQNESDILIYHYAVAWEEGFEYYKRLRCIKILRFHNVTPAVYFAPYHEGVARSCQMGLDRLTNFIRSGVDLYLSASEYNSNVLLEKGADPARIQILPPLHRTDTLEHIFADIRFIQNMGPALYPDRKTFLMIGRIVPNKGYMDLIRAFSYYHKNFNQYSRLLIVGKMDAYLKNYHRELIQLIVEEQLQDHVFFPGSVSDQELKAAYLIADAFVLYSHHEGFCVPLVEAMAMKTPIVAFSSSAIPETLDGDDNLVETNSYEGFARAMHRITTNPDFRNQSVNHGYQRYRARYSLEILERKLLKMVEAI